MAKLTSLCVYCGSRDKVDQAYRTAAADLGRLVAEQGIRMVYGGGHVGLMGICADAALAAGGEVVGVIPEHLHEFEVTHRGLTELHITPDMHSRKFKMFELSDAFAVLPGGLGTLDETFEIFTWRQLGLHGKPIVMVNVNGYWAPFQTMIDHIIETGFAAADNRKLYIMVDSVAAVVSAVRSAPKVTVKPLSKYF